MNAIEKKRGQYLGTRIEHKWWRRYAGEGFLTRGKGEYWIREGSLFFQHHARQKPITLPLCNLIEIKVCPCRDRAGGLPIVKLIWQKDGNWLSSGFVLSDIMDETSHLLTSLRTKGVKS